ncbi:MAG: NTP transferase domain-containing protein [Elusimicrobia bacterium]|nr:NTP transferase domain-containing protein [Elusimicrobiota bacterium]
MSGFELAGRCREGGKFWGVVLAGGQGVRLRPFVKEAFGLEAPKQFVPFMGRRSMFQHTVDRAAMLVPDQRILTVADVRHDALLRAQLGPRLLDGVLYQPCNRETAAGVMLPLTHILERDPEAVVAFLPSDHFILEETRFMRHIAEAMAGASRLDEGVILLGVRPDGPETEYGWIEPGRPLAMPRPYGLRSVRRFIEKPDREEALRSYRKGCLWNSFVTVARAEALYRLIARRLPVLGRAFSRIRAAAGTQRYDGVLAEEYSALPATNLSRDVFQTAPEAVSLLPLEGVTWSDWGSARRIAQTYAALRRRPPWEAACCAAAI